MVRCLTVTFSKNEIYFASKIICVICKATVSASKSSVAYRNLIVLLSSDFKAIFKNAPSISQSMALLFKRNRERNIGISGAKFRPGLAVIMFDEIGFIRDRTENCFHVCRDFIFAYFCIMGHIKEFRVITTFFLIRFSVIPLVECLEIIYLYWLWKYQIFFNLLPSFHKWLLAF